MVDIGAVGTGAPGTLVPEEAEVVILFGFLLVVVDLVAGI